MEDNAVERGEIDLVRYGVLWQKVQDMEKQIGKMDQDIDELLALANKSKGGIWLGMSVVSGVSAIVGFILSHWKGH